ncbi:MAG: DUF1553 domain-containing protein [Verrucomicrobiales bacterium]|nr:DUF1553 domain-containing protein [Verrucomicrobiales bacterium]
MKRFFPIGLFLAIASLLPAQEGGGYRDFIREAAPILYFDFEDGKKPGLGKIVGKVQLNQEGPLAGKETSKFLPKEKNRAAKFEGNGGRIVIPDPGPGSQFDFGNGDPITIECWVSLDEISQGAHAYIIGKGRTGNPGVNANNQNWAFRLTGEGEFGMPNFLFRSADGKAVKGDWHRWKATSGVKTGSGWHHIAVTYLFGKPDSIRAWIDGEPVEGVWDMGGKTEARPVTDDDEIWIGSTLGGSANNSFRGLMDELAVYRREFDEELLADRVVLPNYHPLGDPARIPEGKVLVEVVENLGVKKAWPRRVKNADPRQEYVDEFFALYQLPEKYDDRGLRADRTNPFLVRASSRVTLPEGPLSIFLRTRGAGRLWMDGELIAETEFAYTGGGGHNGVPEVPKLYTPNMRAVGPGDREAMASVIEGDGKEHVFVLETIAGNGSARATLGETSVSISENRGDPYLLTPTAQKVMLTEQGWDDFRYERHAFYRDLNAKRRHEFSAGEREYWTKRHEFAAQKVSAKLAPRELDKLLEKSWANVKTAEDLSPAAREVAAIFSEKCHRCHAEKVKGGLRLDDHEAILKGGDSELPAVVPGKPEESYLVEVTHPDAEDRMPPKGEPLSEKERAAISKWIAEGAERTDRVGSAIEPSLIVNDLDFLRRATLDTTGVVPSPEEIDAFLADDEKTRRAKAIDRLLDDPRWADHWVSYWQDVLAENPNILKPSLNNTGPFRYWIYEALLDNKPMDQFVTELVLMEGSKLGGGPAGFGLAFQNDVPMAAKAHTIGTAFLGVEMKCARCHDAPYHDSTQRDLFELAAMLNTKGIKLPESSTVPAGSIPEGRESLIAMTLKAGETIQPKWPFEELFDAAELPDWVARKGGTPREKVAWSITSPENERFPRVIANRVWKRLLGAGFVDPVDDWEAGKPTHPELLDRLGSHFVASGYDLKELVRIVMNSEAYQRQARPLNPGNDPTFAHPIQRRMSAEQVVDSLFAVSGKPLESEEVTMDNDGTQVEKNMISFGFPRRAWEFTSLSNERDRPSLAIPKAQAVVDVLENFGWRAARAEPKSERETDPNVRQSAIVANGLVGRWVTTLSENHALTELALRENLTLNQFIEGVFKRVLSREPSDSERVIYAEILSEGFDKRIVPENQRPKPKRWEQLGHVAWSNHLSEEANRIKVEMEKRAAIGDFPTVALDRKWRENVEDMLWALLNSPEFVFVP